MAGGKQEADAEICKSPGALMDAEDLGYACTAFATKAPLLCEYSASSALPSRRMHRPSTGRHPRFQTVQRAPEGPRIIPRARQHQRPLQRGNGLFGQVLGF